MSGRLEQLLAAATPGPWEAWDRDGAWVIDAESETVTDSVVARSAPLIALAPDMARLLFDMGEELRAWKTPSAPELLVRLDALGKDTA